MFDLGFAICSVNRVLVLCDMLQEDAKTLARNATNNTQFEVCLFLVPKMQFIL